MLHNYQYQLLWILKDFSLKRSYKTIYELWIENINSFIDTRETDALSRLSYLFQFSVTDFPTSYLALNGHNNNY